MSESNKPFVVTDRRKFTKEGELRPEAAQAAQEQAAAQGLEAQEQHARQQQAPAASAAPQLMPDPASSRSPQTAPEPSQFDLVEEDSLPAPTPEQAEQSRFAYEQTADRLETAIRAANPGGDHPPAMNFDQLVQSIYLTAIMQLGGATPEGQKPQVDILGARQSIDMLAVLGEKTKGNLSAGETKLLDSAIFELRMAFLEITQALARSVAAKGAPPPKPGIVL